MLCGLAGAVLIGLLPLTATLNVNTANSRPATVHETSREVMKKGTIPLPPFLAKVAFPPAKEYAASSEEETVRVSGFLLPGIAERVTGKVVDAAVTDGTAFTYTKATCIPPASLGLTKMQKTAPAALLPSNVTEILLMTGGTLDQVTWRTVATHLDPDRCPTGSQLVLAKTGLGKKMRAAGCMGPKKTLHEVRDVPSSRVLIFLGDSPHDKRDDVIDECDCPAVVLAMLVTLASRRQRIR